MTADKIYSPHDFMQTEFHDTPLSASPVLSWVWNAPIDCSEIDRQLLWMRDSGFHAAYIIPEPPEFRPSTMITTLAPAYLSDEFMSFVVYAAGKARELGITMWLYDEGGWPSGSACGRVTAGHPELRVRLLSQDTLTVCAGQTVFPYSDANQCGAVALFDCNGGRLELPYTASSDITLTLYGVKRGSSPDLLDSAAVERFVSLTHEAYAKAFGEGLSGIIPCFFTDEPCIPYPPYVEPTVFSDRFGYDYRDRLPELFSDGISDTRRDYCDLYSQIAADTYYGSLRKWCGEHGLLSVGHLNNDDRPSEYRTQGGQLLRQLRQFDIPGVDAIWRQIFPSEESANLFFPRFASSAASQNGSPYALTEAFAIYGAGLTFAQMRYTLLFHAVRGVNIFNYMSASLGNDAFAASQARPCFRPESPSMYGLSEFNSFAGRLSYIASVGRPCVSAALYYPITSFWKGDTDVPLESFIRLGRGLDGLQCPYEIIDNDFLSECTLDGGALIMGIAAYSTVYIPAGADIPKPLYKKLLEFEANGGMLFFDIPVTTPVIGLKRQSKAFRTAKRITDAGETVYIIYNESTAWVEDEVTFNESKLPYELDLTSGDIYRSSSTVKLSLDCGECRAFLFTDAEIAVTEKYTVGEKIADITDFTIQKLNSFEITRDGIRLNASPCEPIAAEVGDFSKYFGKSFSGDVIYEFTLPPLEGEALLDLGEVRYCCEAYIQGMSLGVRCMPPYSYVIPAGDERKVTLKLSNTAANAYAATDVTSMFTPAQIGPYHARMLAFEHPDGGLYGPVTINRIDIF